MRRSLKTSAPLLLAMFAATLGAHGQAAAQAPGPDLDARIDLRDPAERERLSTERDFAIASATGEPAPVFRFAAELGGTATSNAFQSADDEVSAIAISPSLSLSATPRAKPLGWTLRASGTVATDRYTRFEDALNESVLQGGVSARREVWKDGTLTLGWTATSAYDADFDDRSVTLNDYALRIDHGFTDRLSGAVSTTWRASDVAGARRAALLGELAYRFAGKPLGASWTASQRLQAADYRAGANDGRNDVFARTELSAEWDVAKDVTAGLIARYAHNFSNRATRRTDTFELAPSVSYTRRF